MDNLGIDTSRTTKTITWGDDIEVLMVSKNHWTDVRIQSVCGVFRRQPVKSKETDNITSEPSTAQKESSLFLTGSEAAQSAPSFTKAVYVKPDLLEVWNATESIPQPTNKHCFFKCFPIMMRFSKAAKDITLASQSNSAFNLMQSHKEPTICDSGQIFQAMWYWCPSSSQSRRIWRTWMGSIPKKNIFRQKLFIDWKLKKAIHHYQNAKSIWQHDTRLDKTREQRLQDALVNVGSSDARETSWTASCWFALALQERDKAMMLSQLTFRESESLTKASAAREETAWSALCLPFLASVPFFSPTLPPSLR